MRVRRPNVLRQSVFILDKKLMADFMMYLPTSVGCWLVSDGVFLYLPYFPFAFPQVLILELL